MREREVGFMVDGKVSFFLEQKIFLVREK